MRPRRFSRLSATALTSSSACTRSVFSSGTATGGRLSARRSTSFLNAATSRKASLASSARTAGRSFLSRSPAASGRAARRVTRSGRCCLAYRLKEEVLAEVPHLQWVFTIPKRLRVYFRYDRSLLGKLCRAAYDTVCDVYALEIDGDCGVPAMVGAVQTFGDLIHWHSHIHAIVPEGVFTDTGHFVHIPDIWRHRAADIWQEKVFDLLLDAFKIDLETAANMRAWKHSGFNVDNSVRIEAGDHEGMQRLVEYISRCPFSLARMVTLIADGRIVYRASKGKCFPFPRTGDPVLPERYTPPIQTLMAGIPRHCREYTKPLNMKYYWNTFNSPQLLPRFCAAGVGRFRLGQYFLRGGRSPVF